MKERLVELPVIREQPKDYDAIEAEILKVLAREIFVPILRDLELPKSTLSNARDSLLKTALESGRLSFWQGEFKGPLSAGLTKELRAIGARWDRDSKTFKIQVSDLPPEIQQAARAGEDRFLRRLDAIDLRLSKMLPEQIAGKLKLRDLFDRTLWKVERDIDKTLSNITIEPNLSVTARKHIADTWQENLELDIKSFTEKQILSLRKKVKASAFEGSRYESLIETIQAAYGTTEKKAKFLARQETSLLMAKFKEVRYSEANVTEYIWGCVKGTSKHPVRDSHRALEGTLQKWKFPPVTTERGQPVRRNNPGEDYNCRCFARPIVRFKK